MAAFKECFLPGKDSCIADTGLLDVHIVLYLFSLVVTRYVLYVANDKSLGC